jgi:small-conductance mechanosensitive channel
MRFDLTPLQDFLRDLAAEASPLQWGVQLAVATLGVALSYFLASTVCRRVRFSARWKFGEGEFERVVFPFTALVVVWVAKLGLEHFAQPVRLLSIAVSLLVAFVVIRTAVYILGYVLPHGASLRLAVRIIAWLAWIGVALHITGLAPDVLEALDDIGFTLGKQKTRVTLLIVLQALAAMVITLTAALWAARITEGRVMAAQTVEMSTRVVISKLIRSAAVVLAILIGLPLAGIDITALSVLGGAIGVGLGFGLQKIASNYVSGFIVLFDRSVRIGDVITVKDRRGTVKAIESRYTVLKAGDGTETIIPNETLITENVIHHTYSDPKVAVILPLAVSYETDVEEACRLLAGIGRSHARVLKDPAPIARVVALGNDGIEMSLTVWIDDPTIGDADMRSELYKAILGTFAERRIEIPYPRRDIRVIATPETRDSVEVSRS